jgi:hypothetical protein
VRVRTLIIVLGKDGDYNNGSYYDETDGKREAWHVDGKEGYL